MDLGTRTGLDPKTTPPRRPITRLSRTRPRPPDCSSGSSTNIARVVQGNDEAIRLAVTCLVAGGHLLSRTCLASARRASARRSSASVSCRHRRIQFTSDLLPSDVTGVSVFDVAKTSFEFRPGPIFANIVLGDEINRTPPKTQSALLESMEERQVTVDGTTYRLPDPFMVIATQNPIEHEGTFPLPVSQLDRFLLRIQIGYPDAESEVTMLETHGVERAARRCLQAVATPEDVVALAARARSVHTSPLIQRYIVQIANATRVHPAVAAWACRRGQPSPCNARREPESRPRGSRLRRARRRQGHGAVGDRPPARAAGGSRSRPEPGRGGARRGAPPGAGARSARSSTDRETCAHSPRPPDDRRSAWSRASSAGSSASRSSSGWPPPPSS